MTLRELGQWLLENRRLPPHDSIIDVPISEIFGTLFVWGLGAVVAYGTAFSAMWLVMLLLLHGAEFFGRVLKVFRIDVGALLGKDRLEKVWDYYVSATVLVSILAAFAFGTFTLDVLLDVF